MDIFKVFKGKKGTKKPVSEPTPHRIHHALDENLQTIKTRLGNANDLLVRTLTLKGAEDVSVAILGIDGIIDTNQAEQ